MSRLQWWALASLAAVTVATLVTMWTGWPSRPGRATLTFVVLYLGGAAITAFTLHAKSLRIATEAVEAAQVANDGWAKSIELTREILASPSGHVAERRGSDRRHDAQAEEGDADGAQK